MRSNFRCPETGKEYTIPKYRAVPTDSGIVYKGTDGRELVSDTGVPLVSIDKEEGFTTAIFGDTNKRVGNRQKWLRERATKHANSLDSKIEKQERTKQEMNNYLNK